MRRTLTAIMAALVVVGTLGAGTALGATQANTSPAETSAQSASLAANETNESNASIAPGERLSGVVGVQEAELEGEVESRSFGLAVARAASNESKAALIAAKVNETERELGNLSEQRTQLQEARQNGSMSQGQFAARMAELSARTNNVERTANDSANASQGLPTELLESKGINATAIQTLRTQAKNLSGGEVSELAQRIAGKRGGEQARGADQRPEDGNQTEAGERGQNRGGQSSGTDTADGTDTEDDTTTTTATDETDTDDTSDDSTSGAGSSSGSGGSDNADRR